MDEVQLDPTGWVTQASEVKYSNSYLTVREDQAVRPDGSLCQYGVVSTNGPGVLIVAFDERNRVALVLADRYPLLEVQLELPGGGGDGEAAEVAAKRELLEECGLVTDSVKFIGSMTVLGGLVNHRNAIVLAQNCKESQASSGEAAVREDDVLGFEFYTVAEVLSLIRNGYIVDAETTCALMQAFLHMDLLTF